MKSSFALASCLLLLGAMSSAPAQTGTASQSMPSIDADARAYQAFASRNQADLARWQSQGGDAARYARGDPKAIYDAASPERDVEILDFVLGSGANPNARRNPNLKEAPIFLSIGDRDKLALLIKYGADVNARDHNNYTPLSHALFAPSSEFRVPQQPRPDQKVRAFAKIDVVRLLLDAGATSNGDLGGLGRAGALGLTRRDDIDVIELLIERGATLKDAGRDLLDFDRETGERGPLTLAIQMDRDDLALALLSRDRRIAQNDTFALLEAARRGFSAAALAFVRAGADPNVADTQGATALAWAVRRRDSTLGHVLREAGAKTPTKPIKANFNSVGLDPFERAVASEIDEVAWFDPDRFALDVYQPRPAVVFAFYSDGTSGYEGIRCERSIAFSLIAYAGDAGSVIVGICRKEALRVRDLARGAEAGLARIVQSLVRSVPNPRDLGKMGWRWQQFDHAGGLKSYSFPVLQVGHGVLWVNTVVLADRPNNRAIVVQADLYHLCQSDHRIRTPLCGDPAAALTEIALRVNGLAAGK